MEPFSFSAFFLGGGGGGVFNWDYEDIEMITTNMTLQNTICIYKAAPASTSKSQRPSRVMNKTISGAVLFSKTCQ
jgi:hypothetical protein